LAGTIELEVGEDDQIDDGESPTMEWDLTKDEEDDQPTLFDPE
jgi:hypothetical protein